MLRVQSIHSEQNAYIGMIHIRLNKVQICPSTVEVFLNFDKDPKKSEVSLFESREIIN